VRSTCRELLIAACRVAPAPNGPAEGAKPEDWREAVRVGEARGLAGHLHTYVTGLPTGVGPDAPTRDRLQAIYYRQAARNAALLNALAEVLGALADRGITPIVLKGPALVEGVYRNVAVRPMQDLDVLVTEPELQAAVSVLEALGYAPDDWYRPAEWYAAGHHHLVPYRRRQITVEIHRALVVPTVPLEPTTVEFFQRARSVTIAGVEALALAPDDLVLHLVLHLAATDRFYGRLGALRDVGEVLIRERDGVDWGRMARSARGLERVVSGTLGVAAAVLGAPVPSEASRALAPGALSPTEQRWLNGIARRALVPVAIEVTGGAPWMVETAVDQLFARRSWAARAGSLVAAGARERAAAGRRLGLDRLALPYGLVVHPWIALARRARATRRTP
jgi:hypothetical protein